MFAKLIVCSTLLLFTQSIAQTNADRFVVIEATLDSLSSHMKGLNGEVELSVSEIRLDEFLRALAMSHNVNISVGDDLGLKVVSNFSKVSVKEVLLFLVKKYNLHIDFSGTILYIIKHQAIAVVRPAKIPNISFDTQTKLLSFDLSTDSLLSVARMITKLTSVNLIVPKSLKNELVSGYIKALTLTQAIHQLGLMNELVVRESSAGIYVFENPVNANQSNRSNNRLNTSNYKGAGSLQLRVDSLSSITLQAENANLKAVLDKVFKTLELNYITFGPIEASVSANLSKVHLDTLLNTLLNATKYTFAKKNGAYFVGERIGEGLRDIQLVDIEHRSCVELSQLIPTELQKDVFIKELPELNALVLEGSKVAIEQLIYFIRQIDKSVPVVMIEVLIVDYIKSRGLDVGIDMGLAEDVIESSGELFPSLNTVKGAASLNQLIDAFDGFGALNIGSVVPNFYVNIKAMENNGVLDVRSTPILTTLNGQEASLSIGNTEYYVVETNNLIGTQNPQSQNTRNWKSVKAELSVKITPNISADSNVTLVIEVNQSNFTNRIEPDAPPGQVSRTFNSLIRVKDGDMILLGGLEELKKEDTNKGVPLLSRIPILKWFFSSKVKANSDKKLNIFIKPTIIG
tara:strand:+ start:1858 stop:3744 length:1887 start_codon:yes stop_codon:yes gene_type:complete